LLLDEPTSRLDPLVQQEFLALVKEPRAGGATVLLSSHVLNEAQRVADRVGVLRAGRLVAEGTVDELTEQARRRVTVLTDAEVPADTWRDVPGLDDLSVDGTHAGIADVLVEEPDLDEAFLHLYRAEDGATDPAAVSDPSGGPVTSWVASSSRR
jgi:ABC-2 type transport system ATP-binding protein